MLAGKIIGMYVGQMADAARQSGGQEFAFFSASSLECRDFNNVKYLRPGGTRSVPIITEVVMTTATILARLGQQGVSPSTLADVQCELLQKDLSRAERFLVVGPGYVCFHNTLGFAPSGFATVDLQS